MPLLALLAAVLALSAPHMTAAEPSCPHAEGGAPQSFHHSGKLPRWYAGELEEFSVVYTDRALNHMSAPFKQVMRDLNAILTEAYGAAQALIMPGSGTFGMEAVARQFANGKDVLVIRNGYFSFRWSDIFAQGGIPKDATVLKAAPTGTGAYAPASLEEVAKAIAEKKPAVVFAPQVETSVGLMLPEGYIKKVAKIAHDNGAIFVLDAIAAGTIWIDMEALGVDALITAPQKGWSGHACAGVVMLSKGGLAALEASADSDSMVLNLKKWKWIMDTYLSDAPPGHAYYATMPTDCLRLFRDMAKETQALGWRHTKDSLLRLGKEVRAMMLSLGLKSVAAPYFEAPGVVVVFAEDGTMPAKLAKQGLQVAAGVPFMLDEAPTPTFRIGLFGLDKINDIEGTVERLRGALIAALAA